MTDFFFNVYFEGRLLASCLTLHAFMSVCRLLQHKRRSPELPTRLRPLPLWSWSPKYRNYQPLTCCDNPTECQLFIHTGKILPSP
jgi:hypothetical protein